ncbi:MAG TPA: type II toxin-antitoxin system VapC family toxin [Mucilaginibacter sp.]|nr:type II toxin-antitoxin system VapC family toxin [Mucilaginibacter sp.]
MGLKYLWDTNTVIYYLQNQFSVSGEKFIDNVVDNSQPVISVITEIELLCWKTATEYDLELLQKFISNSVIYELGQDIKLKTIEIRKQSRLKLPDAIIAATALVNGLILISRNTSDFKKVTSLELLDPFNEI